MTNETIYKGYSIRATADGKFAIRSAGSAVVHCVSKSEAGAKAQINKVTKGA